jgi:hypothetical protein
MTDGRRGSTARCRILLIIYHLLKDPAYARHVKE